MMCNSANVLLRNNKNDQHVAFKSNIQLIRHAKTAKYLLMLQADSIERVSTGL